MEEHGILHYTTLHYTLPFPSAHPVYKYLPFFSKTPNLASSIIVIKPFPYIIEIQNKKYFGGFLADTVIAGAYTWGKSRWCDSCMEDSNKLGGHTREREHPESPFLSQGTFK